MTGLAELARPRPGPGHGRPSGADHRRVRGSRGVLRRKVAEPVVKPGSVWDSHSSSPSVAAGIKQPTRVRHEPCHSTPIWSCSGWGLPCPEALSPRAVGSYPTVSPLPRTLAGRSAVCFLLHFPSAHAAQALPGTLLCGARTFLGALLRRDCLDRLRRGGLSHIRAEGLFCRGFTRMNADQEHTRIKSRWSGAGVAHGHLEPLHRLPSIRVHPRKSVAKRLLRRKGPCAGRR